MNSYYSHSFFPKRSLLLGATALIAGFFIVRAVLGDSEPDEQAQQQQAMQVNVQIVDPKPTQVWKEFSGRLVAVDYVELRPQVSGRVQEIKFEDGQLVETGDVLYVIEPDRYEAVLSQAKAELTAVQNQLNFAQKELDRGEELIKTNDIPKRLLDERISARNVAKASVQNAKSGVRTAQINRDYAYVKAPISGRVSRAEITKGNLVEAGPNAPVLTSIVSNQGIYADFEVDEPTYLRYVRAGARGLNAENKIPVRMSLKKNGEQPYEGVIHTFDNRIDPTSGTIRARAFFANQDEKLLPGMAVSVNMGSAKEEKLITVTERAIGTDQDRKYVYVVSPGNKATYREVKLGESVDGSRIITSGLNAGEKVITEGIMHIRPDTPVNPQVVDPSATAQGTPHSSTQSDTVAQN